MMHVSQVREKRNAYKVLIVETGGKRELGDRAVNGIIVLN
jgi:hypothetical protein